MPPPRRSFLCALCVFLALALSAKGAAVNAAWNAATDVPVNVSSYAAAGNTVSFTLNFAPAPGTTLTVVNNTGLPFISGTFDNLAQGQLVSLSYGGTSYSFVAHYFGGTGNDLVLIWAYSRLVAWGANVSGQLGNSSTTDRSIPSSVPTPGTPLSGRTVLALSAGSTHSLALCTDGTLVAWGDNTYGQLGNITTTSSSVPVAVTTAGTPLAGKTVIAVASGGWHNLALCSDGTLVSWGLNASGQLGNSTNTSSSVPVAVTTAGTQLAGKTVVSIAVGASHCLVLCSDGTLLAWGTSSRRQGGYGVLKSNIPIALPKAYGDLNGKTVVSIASGGDHNIALCSDGTLVAWGSNIYGQLGNGQTQISSEPVTVTTSQFTVLNGKTVVAVAAGEYHSLALCSDGTLAAWGFNGFGQLGSVPFDDNIPWKVNSSGVLAGKTVLGLMAGASHCMVSCADGTAVAWGGDANGQLGDNNTTDSFDPVSVNTSALATGESFMRVTSGPLASHTLALVAAPVPVTVSATTLAASSMGTTTAIVNGTVNANGSSATVSFDYGLDSTYGTNVAGTPYSVSGSTATAVSTTLTGLTPATTYHFRTVGSNGSGNSNGADLTFTTLTAYLSALNPSAGTLSPVFSPTVFSYHSAVETDVGSISITPATADSQATVTVSGNTVGNGIPSGPIPLVYGDNTINVTVTARDGISTVTYVLVVTRAVPASWSVAYATGAEVPVTFNGFTVAGGTVDFALNYAPAPGTTLMVVNNTGLGFISGAFSNLAQGQAVHLNYNGVSYPFVASYFGGTGNDLVLTWANTRPYAWGYNSTGQLGNNTTSNASVPVPATTAGTPLAGRTLLALSAGSGHSLALCVDGTLAAWGSNSYGALGNGLNTDSKVPVAVTTQDTPLQGRIVVAASSGANHNLVLCSDGTLAAWGGNSNSQLGNGTTTGTSVPVAVTTLGTPLAGKTVVAVSAGAYHNLSLCSDGTIAAWGYNFYGQLGNNSSADSSIPVAVTTAGTPLAGKTVVAVSAGTYHSLALCSDGTLLTWGANFYRQLGNASSTSSSVPVAVSTTGTILAGKTVVTLAAGGYHNLVLCSDGTLAAWGSDIYGELGDNSTQFSSIPIMVNMSGALAGKTVVSLSAGNSLSLARCTDGTLAALGFNLYGQLGNNSTASSPIPVAVSTSSIGTGGQFIHVATGKDSNDTLALAALPVPATTFTLAATSITGTSAVLNGSVNANGSAADVSFDYGLTTAYGMTVAASPSVVTGAAGTAVTGGLTGLTPGTTYHFRARGSNAAGAVTGTDLTFTTGPLSLLQIWRQTYFGTTANGGAAADTADNDADGIPNLIEYALRLNPTTTSKLPATTTANGANLEYTYTRSTAAVNVGTDFKVEWSSTLAHPATWSSSAVTQTVLSDDGTTQQVKAVIPMNAATTMFVRLSVTAPP
ncbi:cadherin-like beta sandwich domain-containing protein [Prosthecobacter sp.]|uniref:RCC1 domain-containing protein n=1 Tax=Prosthecobacter sp. TaxID=1965333 RepID=UPI00378401E4